MKYQSNNDYVDEIRRKLETTNRDKEFIDQRINKIQKNYDDIDSIIKRKGWKYMKNRYLSEYNDSSIFFYQSGMGYNCMCIESVPEYYIVTFTFIHSMDFDNIDNDYKKYCIYNFVNNKYTYTVHATSFLNAIASANNKNCFNFPKRCQYKIVPELHWCLNGCPKGIMIKPNCKEITDRKQYFKEYQDAKSKLLDLGYDHSNIRYYNFDRDITILVLRKDGKYKVVFSFVNESDMEMVNSLKNDGDYKHLSRSCVINNFINNKYCYDCNQARNSITAAYYAFNDHVKDFPGRFKKCRVFIELQHYIED